jgi:hypothetical protein
MEIKSILLLISLMTEEAAVLGRMVFGQRSDPVRRVAFPAEFFRRLLIHLHESGMIIIIGQKLGGLLGRSPEKEKEATTDNYKNQVVDDYAFPFHFLFFCIHYIP